MVVEIMEEGQVPGGKVENWRKEDACHEEKSERLQEEFHDDTFMAQRRMWHLRKQSTGNVRRGSVRQSENIVREYKAVAAGEVVQVLWSGGIIFETGSQNQFNLIGASRNAESRENNLERFDNNSQPTRLSWEDVRVTLMLKGTTLTEGCDDFQWKKRTEN